MKTLTTAILVIALVTIAGCRKKENQDTEIRPPHVSLQIAALQGNVDAISQHINASSNLDVKDEYGSTPLIIATTFGKTEVARALIDGGADMEITNNEGAMMPPYTDCLLVGLNYLSQGIPDIEAVLDFIAQTRPSRTHISGEQLDPRDVTH